MSEFIVVAKLSEIEEGKIYALDLEDAPVALTCVNGVIHAFGDICTHDDGPLADGDVTECCVVCPRHGATFDLRTGAPTFPAAAPIPIYETRIEGDDVLIRL